MTDSVNHHCRCALCGSQRLIVHPCGGHGKSRVVCRNCGHTTIRAARNPWLAWDRANGDGSCVRVILWFAVLALAALLIALVCSCRTYYVYTPIYGDCPEIRVNVPVEKTTTVSPETPVSIVPK